jgi:hypothetical protein
VGEIFECEVCGDRVSGEIVVAAEQVAMYEGGRPDQIRSDGRVAYFHADHWDQRQGGPWRIIARRTATSEEAGG